MVDTVSVVMPVRNEIAFIDQSISSILAQSHTDFELILGDDGSTDGTYERLQEWARRDSRIRVVGPSTGLGPSRSSNWVMSFARNPIVARMDGDDTCHPERLTEQLRVLKEHADAALVGCVFDTIDSGGRSLRGPFRARGLSDPTSCAAPFAHGSIMFRRNAFYAAGGYRIDCRYWEDVEFFWRMASVGRLLVLTQSLYSYRHSLGSTRLTDEWTEVIRALALSFRCTAAHQQGKDYRKILDSPDNDNDKQFALDSFIALGRLRLWSGHRPRVLGRILRHARHCCNRRILAAILWTAGAEISPRLMRRLFRLGASAKERGFRHRAEGERVFEWRPPQAPVLAFQGIANIGSG
jgi:glycosyltransferase involved in cell wall biosynthesis